MARYEHTQTKAVLAALLFAIGLIAFVGALAAEEPGYFGLPAVFLFISFVGYALSRLTTTVDEEHVTIEFRWGWPKQTISLSDVSTVATAKNKWWFGLGIRLLPDSTTMYNVWGLDAVHLDLNGRRNFRIGTDDPQGLAAAIAARIDDA